MKEVNYKIRLRVIRSANGQVGKQVHRQVSWLVDGEVSWQIKEKTGLGVEKQVYSQVQEELR